MHLNTLPQTEGVLPAIFSRQALGVVRHAKRADALGARREDTNNSTTYGRYFSTRHIMVLRALGPANLDLLRHRNVGDDQRRRHNRELTAVALQAPHRSNCAADH